MLQVQELPDPLTVKTHLCHTGRSHRWGGPGKLSSPKVRESLSSSDGDRLGCSHNGQFS